MTEPKPFQLATVEAALTAFKEKTRPRRFLVADEVGLGKTVVAQHVIKRLMEGRRKPLVVFYVCSSLAIAGQNQRKLLEILPEEGREEATCPVDRLTLMPAADRPSHPRLHLYTLTPGTSIPLRRGRRRDGRQEERALIHVLVEAIWPRLLDERGHDIFQRSAKVDWQGWVEWQRGKVTGALKQAFALSVRTEFNLRKRQKLVPALRKYEDPLQIIAHFRNALAATAIEEVQPDLVIFDEFQRFRDLISRDVDKAAARVIERLRGDNTPNSPALLLLSATPYRLYSRRIEDAIGTLHHSEFFDLIEFLYGGDAAARSKRKECESAFSILEKELRKGAPASEEATIARNCIQQVLHPILSRTERASHPKGWTDHSTIPIQAELKPVDIKIYRHLNNSFRPRYRFSAVPYWTSIPFPMQTMGNNYVAWKYSETASLRGVPIFTKAMRDKLRQFKHLPHPRMRALQGLLPPNELALPWVTPSLPWWRLRRGWKSRGRGPRKALIFSRFRAIPQAVASLMSYNLETKLLSGQNLPYSEITRRRLLQATGSRYPLLALFFPSPLLVWFTEPLSSGERTIGAIRRNIRRQIVSMLAGLDVPIRKSNRRSRPIWLLLACLESRAGNWPWVYDAWWKIYRQVQSGGDSEVGMGQLLTQWGGKAQEPLDYLTNREVDALARHALASPGIALGRALYRHWPEAVSQSCFLLTLDVCWNGLRTYLDQRWFVAALGAGEKNYPSVIKRAVLDGNLESVLDEHLWIISKLYTLRGASLAEELRDSLQLRNSIFRFHTLKKRGADTFSIRCHAAMPFLEARIVTLGVGERLERPLRVEELRKAFNTPFWPHVLITTSIGQEGLDFHTWCRTLIHWDICSNPVDLEQREGRIQRFGGLSVRRIIAKRLGEQVLKNLQAGASPWEELGSLAESDEEISDKSGLCPWWICDGAEIKRHVFDVPTSEQAYRLSWLKEQRLLYRIALGQPNQEDLLEVLSARGDFRPDEIREFMVGLSPWFEGKEAGCRKTLPSGCRYLRSSR